MSSDQDIIQLGISLDATGAAAAAAGFSQKLDEVTAANMRMQEQLGKASAGNNQAANALSSTGEEAKKAGTAMSFLGGAWKGLVTAFGGYLAFKEVVHLFQEAVAYAAEFEASTFRLQAALKATGGAAGMTQESLERLAQTLHRTTLFDDEQIRDAEALLLSFRTIQGKQFEETMRRAADFSALTGRSLSASAMMLGKAMAEPEQGITALGRAGVRLSASVIESIKHMAKMGETVKAQDMLLEQLAKRVGGTAEAADDGLPGSIHRAHKAWHEFLEGLGETSVVRDSVMAVMNTISQTLDYWTPGYGKAKLQKQVASLNDRIETAQTPGPLTPTFDSAIDQMLEEKRVLEQQIRIYDILEGVHQRAADAAAKEAFAQAERDREELERVKILNQLEAETASLGKTSYEAARIQVAANRNMTDSVKAAQYAAINAQQAFDDLHAEMQAKVDISSLGATEEQAQLLALSLEVLTDRQRKARESVIHATAEYKVWEDQMKANTEANEKFLNGLRDQVKAVDDRQHSMDESNKDMAEQIRLTKLLGADNAAVVMETHRLRREFMATGPSQPDIEAFERKLQLNEQERIALQGMVELSGDWEKAWRSAIENIQSELADFIVSIGDGAANATKMLQNMLKMVQRIAAEIAAAKLTKLITGLVDIGMGGLPGAPNIGDITPTSLPASLPTSYVQSYGNAPTSTGPALGAPVAYGAAPSMPPTSITAPRGASVDTGATVNIQVSPQFVVTSLDPRGAAEVIRAQRGVLGSMMVEMVRDSRELQSALRGR